MGNKQSRNEATAVEHEVLYVFFRNAEALDLGPLASALRAKLATSEPAWRPALFADVAMVHVHDIRAHPQSRHGAHGHELIITLTDGHGAPSKQDMAEVEQVVRDSFPLLDNLRLAAGQDFRLDPFYYRSQLDTIWTTIGRTTNVHSDFKAHAPASLQSTKPKRTFTSQRTLCGWFGVCICFSSPKRITDEYD